MQRLIFTACVPVPYTHRRTTGLQYRELVEGTGPEAVPGAVCEITYVVYRLSSGAYYKYSSGGTPVFLFSFGYGQQGQDDVGKVYRFRCRSLVWCIRLHTLPHVRQAHNFHACKSGPLIPTSRAYSPAGPHPRGPTRTPCPMLTAPDHTRPQADTAGFLCGCVADAASAPATHSRHLPTSAPALLCCVAPVYQHLSAACSGIVRLRLVPQFQHLPRGLASTTA